MKICQPIVYTRPREVSTLDYCYFVRPKALDGMAQVQREVDSHIRNVLSEDGYRGEIKGVRWHLFRLLDYVLVGIATREFGRNDALGRPIRGYYGVLMNAEDAVIPSMEFYKEIDRRYVAPLFETRSRIVPELVERMPFLMDELACVDANVHCDTTCDFNDDVKKIRCFPELNEYSISRTLAVALCKAKRTARFEIVAGLNNITHACLMPIMNAYVAEVKTVVDRVCEVNAPINNTSDCKWSEQRRQPKYEHVAPASYVEETDLPQSSKSIRSTSSTLGKVLAWIVHLFRRDMQDNQSDSFNDKRNDAWADIKKVSKPDLRAKEICPDWGFGLRTDRKN